MSDKFCKDCKYCTAIDRFENGELRPVSLIYRCSNPVLLRNTLGYYVHGGTEPQPCELFRAGGDCGTVGKYFEAKQP